MFGFSKSADKRIYMDYASTTPVDRDVLKAMKPYFIESFYNSSSIYKEGVDNKKVLEECRRKVASYFKSKPEEIVFTGSGTESDNLAIRGVVEGYKKGGAGRPHIITSTIEHPAVLETFLALQEDGVDVTFVSPRKDGRVHPDDVRSELKTNTVLVSLIHVQNEIGTIQPTKDIERELKNFKKTMGRDESDFPHLHVDASQSPNYIKCTKEKLGAGLITLDGSKIYGPKGVGVLYVDKNINIEPIMFGGGQENGLRPGTENLPLIVGFAEALLLTESKREYETERMIRLQKYFVGKLVKRFKDININGTLKYRVPNNVNICFPQIDAEFTVIALSEKGVMCSFMTACKNIGDSLYSYVIESINPDCKSSSLRFTMGRDTTKKDIDFVIDKLSEILKE